MNRLWRLGCRRLFRRPLKWVPILGELQKTLQKGEYLPLRPLPMFESNFVQVTNQGSPVFVHHGTNRVTMGVAASLPGLGMPDILLIARPPDGTPGADLVLTRLIPMALVNLYVHDLAACRLKLRLVSGRAYYLELDAPSHELSFLFNRWLRLVNLLQRPLITWVPRTSFTPPLALAHTDAPASTWHLQNELPTGRSATAGEPTFQHVILASQRPRKVKAPKRRFKSQAVGDSVPLIWSQLEHGDPRKKHRDKKASRDLQTLRPQAQPRTSEKHSLTIRTIFSIISNTVNTTQSSAKVPPNSSREGCLTHSFTEPPAACLPPKPRDPSLRGSYDQLGRFLWQQNLEELMDPESSTLSSSTLSPPTFYLEAPYSSSPGHAARAQPPGAPPTQRGTSVCTPFILDRSQRVPAVQATPRKMSTGLSRKNPPSPSAPPKTPARPGPTRKDPLKTPTRPGHSRKQRPVLTHRSKTPGAPAPSRKGPPAPALPTKAPSLQGPSWKSPATPSQKALVPPPHSSLEDGAVGGQRAPRSQRPFATNITSSPELLVSRARRVTVVGLKGAHTQQDRQTHCTEEEAAVDVAGFKSQHAGQQQTWVRAQAPAVEAPPREQSRPFSVEGLALAKLVIMARAQDVPLPPMLASLPSWLSLHQASILSLWGPGPPPRLGQGSLPEGRPRDPAGAPGVSPRSRRNPGDPKTHSASQMPIALPACRWEDLPPPQPRSPSPHPRPPPQSRRGPLEPRRAPFHCPLARAGSHSEILLPSLLELMTRSGPVAKVDTVLEQLGACAPPPSSLGLQRP